jgi:hypothetical protein
VPQERLPTLTQNFELPFLSLKQIEFLKSFALLEARLADIRDVLAGVFEFDFVGRNRMARSMFRVPEPGVIVTRNHIHNAVEKRKLGKLSERELIFWATMLLLNDAFEPDPNDQEYVAEWLNDVSFNGFSRENGGVGGDAE